MHVSLDALASLDTLETMHAWKSVHALETMHAACRGVRLHAGEYVCMRFCRWRARTKSSFSSGSSGIDAGCDTKWGGGRLDADGLATKIGAAQLRE